MKYWLLKTEPSTFSIDMLKEKKLEPWTGVRNYQARNNMLAMSLGDLCLIYHSSCDEIGITGIAKVSKIKVVDETQFDSKSEYFDPKSTIEKPRWYCVEVKFVKKFKNILTLAKIKQDKKLSKMVLVQPGSRLSVQPVRIEEYKQILLISHNVTNKK